MKSAFHPSKVSPVYKRRPLCSAIALSMMVFSSVPVFAQAAPEDDKKALDNVIVTGTRRVGMTASDSPAPVQVISVEALQESGAPDLMNQLANQVPSFNAEQRGGDMSQQTLKANLRALSSNHTLTLINGKRRHTTSNISTSGASGADLSFIPTGAIASTEVLTDGAAALYGSDAIAGVVNIITKKQSNGGSLDYKISGYEDGGGTSKGWSGNYGFSNDRGYFNIAIEHEEREPIVRAGLLGAAQCVADMVACQAAIDAGLISRATFTNYMLRDQGMLFNENFPYNNRIGGTGSYKRDIGFLSAGTYLGETTELYSWASFGNKHSWSWENYRRPSQDGGFDADGNGSITGSELLINKYPTGFLPKEDGREKDYSLAVGITGELAGWQYDLATVYGKNVMDVYTTDSMNFSLWNQFGYSPENFYDGTFNASQWTTSLDVSKDFEIGLAGPMTLAAGLEYREDSYGIDAGDPASYYGAGASSFPGYSPDVAGSWDRGSSAFFVNAILQPLDNWIVDLAVRTEKYEELDRETVGKFTTRYDFNDKFAMRFTASTGFRAPNLGEGHYSTVAVGPTSASLLLGGSSDAVAGLGYEKLKPETSTSYSLGFVFKPIDGLTTTIDAYSIELKDRVSSVSLSYSQGQSNDPASETYRQTGSWDTSQPDPGDINKDGVRDSEYNLAVGQILAGWGYIGYDANGLPNPNAIYGGSMDATARANVSLSFLSNLYDTRTSGVDWVTTYSTAFDWGRIDWNLAANYNKTKVLSSVVNAMGIPALNAATIEGMENGDVKYRVNLGATIHFGKFTLAIREQFYGPSYSVSSTSRTGAQWAATQQDFEEITHLGTASTVYYKNEYDAMALTNVELSYKYNDKLRFSIGGDNVFNKYPNKIENSLYEYQLARYSTGSSIYKTGHPIGYFGTRWFGKVTYNF